MIVTDLEDAESAGAALAALMNGTSEQCAPVGLACLDRDFRFVRVNDALTEMNRLPVDDHRPMYVV